MPGPAPKPTVLEILQGNPSKRPINREEPRPSSDSPRCPTDLDAGARRVWRQLLPILQDMRVMTEADGMALANLCRLESRRRKAEADLERGLFYANKQTGVAHVSPAFQIVMECERQLLNLSREFGLTPAARTRIRVEKEKDGRNALEDALCG